MSSTLKVVSLGGTASSVRVAGIGYGLMMMTWTPAPTPDEQAFEAIKTAIEQVPEGSKLLINSGEFYGVSPRTANLELVSRFFARYPRLADRTFISVKGGTGRDNLIPNSSPENLRASVEAIRKALGGNKKLDLFECARVDPQYSIEETITYLKALVEEGLFDHIGISEVSADTLRRANKVYSIAAVEIEVSPWSYEDETKRVIAAAEELGVAVVAYSPLGRGFLTGQLKREDLPEGDFRRSLARFQDDAIAHNKTFVDALTAIAARQGLTSAQLSLAWITSLGSRVIPLPGSSKPNRVIENMSAAKANISKEDLDDITAAVDAFSQDIKGGRYFSADGKGEHLWG